MSQPFKIDELLKDHGEDQAALEAYARDPGRSIDELQIWLEARGYVVSRGAVWNWKQKFDEQRLALRMNASGGLARAFMEAAKSGDGMQIPDAAVLQLSQMVFEQAAKLAGNGEISTEDLANLSLAMQRTTLAKVRIEDVRQQFVKQQKTALEAAEKVAKEGGSPVQVIDKVRELLGIGSPAGQKKGAA